MQRYLIILLSVLSFSVLSCKKSNSDTSNRTSGERVGWSCKIDGVLYEWWHEDNDFNINDLIATGSTNNYAICTINEGQIALSKKITNGDIVLISIITPLNTGTYTMNPTNYNQNTFANTFTYAYTSGTSNVSSYSTIAGGSMTVKISRVTPGNLGKTVGEFSGTAKLPTSSGTVTITEGRFVAVNTDN